MGTSSSGNGPRPTTPLIPSWIPQAEPSEPPHEDQGHDGEVDDSNESSQEEGETEGVETESTNGDETSPNRYADSRHKFSSAFKSNGDRGPILTAAIRSYVSRGGGGSSKMAKRLAPSAFRVAKFGIVLNTFREHGASAALRTFDLQNYASRPVIEVLSALTDIIFDKSSPYSDIKDDSITKLAYANTINRVAQMESIDLDSLTNENIEVMLAIFIEETITTRVICDIGAKPYKNERNAEEILQMEETVFQIVSGLVRNRIMPQIMASQRGSQEELERNIQNIYRIAFDCIIDSE